MLSRWNCMTTLRALFHRPIFSRRWQATVIASRKRRFVRTSFIVNCPMRIALITTDNREPSREYAKPLPWFGTAPEALLHGMAQVAGIQVHVIGCSQRPMVSSPEKLADNIWFHSVVVPKFGWLRTAYQGCVRAVRHKLHELKPDIVHG